MFRVVVIAVAVIVISVGAAVAQVPESASPAQTVLQQAPTVELPAEECTAVRPRWYAGVGTLVAPPILLNAIDGERGLIAMPPIPSAWGEFGFRRANDVRWQVSYLFVPMLDSGDHLFGAFLSTHGLDVDRISTNRSDNPEFDLRWQVGLR